MVEMGPWDGERATLPDPAPASANAPAQGQVALATWKLMLDNGSMQDGEKYLRATGRRPVCRVSPSAAAALGAMVTLEGDRGSVTLPVEVADDLADDVVWVPANSTGKGVLADLASPGSGVRLKGAEQ
jgi:NADH-quinone oxidoreductase subunit G